MENKIIPIIDDARQVDPLQTICDLKWNYPIFNMDRGEFRSCCRTPPRQVKQEELDANGINAFLNSDHQIQSRLDLIQGLRHKDCQSCWNLEDRGMASPRHDAPKFWDHLQRRKLIDQSLEYSEDTLKLELSNITYFDHPALKSRHPYMLEISLGNTCDMKCMYCSHHYSTQWGTERIKWGEITQEQYDNEFPKAPAGFDDAFWKWFDTVKLYLGRLGIIGGEPLIMPEFYTFVDKLIASTAQVRNVRKEKMKFWIVTNMNTPPNYLEKFFKYLPKMTEVFDVEILVSMESVGKRAEYIRNGVHWDKFINNIDKLLSRKDLNFEFGFILSLNVLNVSNLREFIEFAENLYFMHNKPVALKHNIISFPDWQSPFILTPDFADYIDECIDYMKVRTDIMPVVSDYFGRWDQYIIFLETLSNSIRTGTGDKTKERKKFVEWFNTYDHRRNTNLLETFPEYENFYKMCEQLNE
jgi:pyruvate-formate lyase-activating enzyme